MALARAISFIFNKFWVSFRVPFGFGFGLRFGFGCGLVDTTSQKMSDEGAAEVVPEGNADDSGDAPKINVRDMFSVKIQGLSSGDFDKQALADILTEKFGEVGEVHVPKRRARPGVQPLVFARFIEEKAQNAALEAEKVMFGDIEITMIKALPMSKPKSEMFPIKVAPVEKEQKTALREFCEKFGKVGLCNFNNASSRRKGKPEYLIVWFDEQAGLEAALAEKDVEFKGKPLVFEKYDEQAEKEKRNNNSNKRKADTDNSQNNKRGRRSRRRSSRSPDRYPRGPPPGRYRDEYYGGYRDPPPRYSRRDDYWDRRDDYDYHRRDEPYRRGYYADGPGGYPPRDRDGYPPRDYSPPRGGRGPPPRRGDHDPYPPPRRGDHDPYPPPRRGDHDPYPPPRRGDPHDSYPPPRRGDPHDSYPPPRRGDPHDPYPAPRRGEHDPYPPQGGEHRGEQDAYGLGRGGGHPVNGQRGEGDNFYPA